MDVSGSVISENINIKYKIAEVIESSVNIMEKGTANIFKELNKMREEYSGVINKFLDSCEREGINLDFLEDNSMVNNARAFANKKESTGDAKLHKYTNNRKYIKNFQNENFAIKKSLDTKTKNLRAGLLFNSYVLSAKNNSVVKLYTKSKNNSFLNKRSKSPKGLETLIKQNSFPKEKEKDRDSSLYTVEETHVSSNPSNNKLPKIEKNGISPQNNCSINLQQNNLQNNLNPAINKAKSPNNLTPNKKYENKYKNEFKDLLNINPNNNYTSKFIKKKSTEMLNGFNRHTSSISQNASANNISLNIGNANHNTVMHNSKSSSKKRNPHLSDSATIYNNKEIKENLNIPSFNSPEPYIKNVIITEENNINNIDNIIKPISSALANKNEKRKLIDDRKLSILDIPADVETFVNLDKIYKQNNYYNDSRHSLNNFTNPHINITGNSIDSFSEEDEVKDQIITQTTGNKLEILNKFQYKYEKLFYILSRSEVIFASMTKNVKAEMPTDKILLNYLTLLNKNNLKYEKNLAHHLKNPEVEKMVNKHFKPSKTAQNGLNFIIKEDEISLADPESLNTIEEVNVFKMIFILMKQNYVKIEDRMIPDYLLNKILVKFKIDNLKSLFLNVICHNLLLSGKQYSQLVNLVESNKNVINPPYMLKINKVVAYLTFMLKEIYEYVNLKTDDGIIVLDLKKQKAELKTCREKILKIESFLRQYSD